MLRKQNKEDSGFSKNIQAIYHFLIVISLYVINAYMLK